MKILMVLTSHDKLGSTGKGGNYVKGADWQSFSVHDGNLITGQNPASSEAVAKMVLEQL